MLPPGWALGGRVRWFVGLLFLIGSGAWAAVPGVGRLVGCTRVRYLCLFVCSAACLILFTLGGWWLGFLG